MHPISPSPAEDAQSSSRPISDSSLQTRMPRVGSASVLPSLNSAQPLGQILNFAQPILHVTVSNKPHPGLDLLLASTSKFATLQSRVLGLGSQTPIGHGKNGFGLKLELLKQELTLLDPFRPVLFTDAWDVLIQSSTDPLLEWLESHPGKVLFAAETVKWPDVNLMYPVPLQFPFPFLNSGCFFGRAQDILKLLQKPFNSKTDDQGYYSEQFVHANSIIELDHEAKYFLCMCKVAASDLQFQNGGVLYKGHRPIVLHLNNGMTRMRYFQSATRSVLGESFVPLARKIVWSIILSGVDAWPWKWIAVIVLLVWLLKTFIWKQGILLF